MLWQNIPYLDRLGWMRPVRTAQLSWVAVIEDQPTQLYVAPKEEQAPRATLLLLPSANHCQKLILAENRGENANFQTGKRGENRHSLLRELLPFL